MNRPCGKTPRLSSLPFRLPSPPLRQTVLVELMGWEPHIVAELDATGFHKVPTDFHAPMHLPAHAPMRALTRTPVPVPVHLPAHAPARALTCVPVPMPVHTNVSAAPLTAPFPARVLVPPSAAWMVAVDRFLAPTPVASSRQLTRSWRPKSRTFWPSLKLGQRPGERQQRRKTPPSPSVSGPTTHRAR